MLYQLSYRPGSAAGKAAFAEGQCFALRSRLFQDNIAGPPRRVGRRPTAIRPTRRVGPAEPIATASEILYFSHHMKFAPRYRS